MPNVPRLPNWSPRTSLVTFVYPTPRMINTAPVSYYPRVPGVAYYPRVTSSGYVTRTPLREVFRPTTLGLQPGASAGTSSGGSSGGGRRPGSLITAPGTILNSLLNVFRGGGRAQGGSFRRDGVPPNFMAPGYRPTRVLPFPGAVTAPGAAEGPGASNAAAAEASGGGGGGADPEGGGSAASSEAALVEGTLWEMMPWWQKVGIAAALAGAAWYGYKRWAGKKKHGDKSGEKPLLSNPRRRRAKPTLASMGVKKRGKTYSWGGLK